MAADETAIDRRAIALLARYRSPAVLLHRPCPPKATGHGTSFFGGLPTLPPGLEWPRTSGGVPLHFLCQIDCADIGWQTPLPGKGILFFFGRDDEEQLWGEGAPADDCRVLYAPDGAGSGTQAAAPGDLPPVGGDYPRFSFHDIATEGTAQSLHVKWPIEPLPMDSLPDTDGLPDVVREFDRSARRFHRAFRLRPFLRLLFPWMRRFPQTYRPSPDQPVWDRYGELLPRARALAFEDATGEDIREEQGPAFGWQQGLRIFGDESFPQRWVFIHFFARAALRRHRSSGAFDHPAPSAEARLDDEAQTWLERSRAALPDAIPDAEVRREFRAWMSGIGRRPGEASPGYRALDWLRTAAVWAIRTWASEPDLAAAIPASVHDGTKDLFATNSVQRGEERDWYRFQFSQMLGHAPASQGAKAADDPEICLLNLASDSGLGWSFGDAGECSFWIAPGDLARRDFSRVRGTIEGH
ncbi:MAG: DUF1963 domain-containing protein [Sphingopyxis sp.]|nr:DUF1963 domain-containing protein [Sphingopyxis sp.]